MNANGRKLIGFNLACLSLLIIIAAYWYTRELNNAANAWNARKKQHTAKPADTVIFNPIIEHSKIPSK